MVTETGSRKTLDGRPTTPPPTRLASTPLRCQVPSSSRSWTLGENDLIYDTRFALREFAGPWPLFVDATRCIQGPAHLELRNTRDPLVYFTCSTARHQMLALPDREQAKSFDRDHDIAALFYAHARLAAS